MRQFIYHCRRIERRLLEMQNYHDLSAIQNDNFNAEIDRYEEFLANISLTKSDYFFREYTNIWDMLQEVRARINEN